MLLAHNFQSLWRNQQMEKDIINRLLPLDTVQVIHFDVNLTPFGSALLGVTLNAGVFVALERRLALP
jgi:hypothetical protein